MIHSNYPWTVTGHGSGDRASCTGTVYRQETKVEEGGPWLSRARLTVCGMLYIQC